ncbi:hypothetical protein PG985_011114 [Apiospora marii]|uniref:uncharacterized protein n=1 Tax=Apiospora marii TaxID=335849 RepID=UPI00312CD40D
MITPRRTGFDSLLIRDDYDVLESGSQEKERKSRWADLRQRVATWTRETRQQMDAEFKSVQWRRQLLFVPFFFWLTFLVVVTVVLIGRGASGMGLTSTPSACMEDGTVNPGRDQQSLFSLGFFDITLKTNTYTFGGSSSMSFATVKVIDIAWDVIIGRGGQGLMTVISWKVYRHYVSASMQTAPVTYQTFRCVFINGDANVATPYRLAKDFIKRRRLISTTAMIFIVVSTLFVLVFPTLAGSMTGYIGVMMSFVKDHNGKLIPFAKFDYVAYIIHDGKRLNLTDDYIVTYGNNAGSQSMYDPLAMSPSPVCSDASRACAIKNATSICTPESTQAKHENNVCTNLLLVDVSRYGFNGLNDAISEWDMAPELLILEPPALNISAFYLSAPPPGKKPDNMLYGNDWVDPRTGQRPFNDITRLTWTANGLLFTEDDIIRNGACQPLMNVYEWGFSLLQALMNCVLLGIWSIGLWLLWLAAQFKLPHRRDREVAKGWRAVSYLADTMRQQFDEAGISPRSLREKPLTQQINKSLNGGEISFIPEDKEKSQLSLGYGLLLWFKQNKWWCLVLLMLLLGTGLSQRPVMYPLFATVYGMLMAMALVDGVASRLLIILPFAIMSLFGLFFALLYGT